MGIDVLQEAKDQLDTEKYIKRINNDLDEIKSLVNTLRQYSSLDEFKIRLKNEPVDLRQLIPNLIENTNTNTTDIDITTNFTKDNIVVNTDPQYLTMFLVNSLSNALQHANSFVEVNVKINDGIKALESNRTGVLVTIEDDGNGISENDQAHVTKPFWRGVGNAEIKGHGLGLAIAACIAQWLRAELVISKSASLGGASISLLFRA